jgi:fluoride exporter
LIRFLTHPLTLVFLGGGTGSVLRYLTGRLVIGAAFPVSILLVNGLASFVLGATMGWTLTRATTTDEVRLLIGVGFCGGLSTFSSFSQDTVVLLQAGRVGVALLNIGLNVGLCLLASVGGLWLGQRYF